MPNQLKAQDIDNTFALRPRFTFFSELDVETICERFAEIASIYETDYKIKRVDNHIFLSMGIIQREYYSPNLQLELETYEDGRTHIRAVFGPDPVLWTLFMFLHFIVAGIFIIFAAIAYSKWSLSQTYTFDVVIMFIMTNLWFLLYFIARFNRKKGIPQSAELLSLVQQVIHK